MSQESSPPLFRRKWRSAGFKAGETMIWLHRNTFCIKYVREQDENGIVKNVLASVPVIVL